jgi:hypothetical protein
MESMRILGLALLLLAPLAAQTKPTLQDLSWLEGRWAGANGDGVNEEWFSAPKNGTIAVMFRMTSKDKTLIQIFGSISEEKGEIVLLQRSFGPLMEPYDTETLRLVLKSYDGTTAEFVNPKHTKPKRTLMIREGSDGLAVRSEIVWDNGKEEVHALSMKRVQPTPPAPSPARPPA